MKRINNIILSLRVLNLAFKKKARIHIYDNELPNKVKIDIYYPLFSNNIPKWLLKGNKTVYKWGVVGHHKISYTLHNTEITLWVNYVYTKNNLPPVIFENKNSEDLKAVDVILPTINELHKNSSNGKFSYSPSSDYWSTVIEEASKTRDFLKRTANYQGSIAQLAENENIPNWANNQEEEI